MDASSRRRYGKLVDAMCEGEAASVRPNEKHLAKHAFEQADDWLNQDCVQGVCVGTKHSQYQDTGRPCITVYVDKKRPNEKTKRPIPQTFKFSSGETVELDVEEIGELVAHNSVERKRPIHPGLNVSHHDRHPGTLGFIVQSKQVPKRIFLMSCAHVLAPYHSSTTDAVYQPGRFNGNRDTDQIGSFSMAIPIKYSETGFPNIADIALAEVEGFDGVNPAIPYFGIPKGVSGKIVKDMLVKAHGMASGRVAGTVINSDFRARLTYYDNQGNKVYAGFQQVVLCTRYGDEGDSGAAILNSSNQLIGLHIGGSNTSSIFCRIIPAMNYFGVWPVTAPTPQDEAATQLREREAFPIAQPDYLASICLPHSVFNSVSWELTQNGISVEGEVHYSPGALVTIPRVIDAYHNEIRAASSTFMVPYELIVATICTESSGRSDVIREEPGYVSDDATPHRVSAGLMQTLLATAREALGNQSIFRNDLLQPATSIAAGTAYISQQFHFTSFDPPKVSCAYNAGGIYQNKSNKNRWKMRQYPIGSSQHADRFVLWFNDCFRYFSESGAAAPEISLYRFLND